MDFFVLTMRVLSALIMVYIFLITIRILLSWVSGSSPQTQKFLYFLNKLTDPYMNLFRGIKWLRFGALDFSPVFAMAILSFFLFLTQSFSIRVFPKISDLLIWIIQMGWGIVAFLITILSIVILLRLILIYLPKKDKFASISHRLDSFLFPRIARILGIFTQKPVSYPLSLLLAMVGLFLVRILVGLALFNYLYPFLARL